MLSRILKKYVTKNSNIWKKKIQMILNCYFIAIYGLYITYTIPTKNSNRLKKKCKWYFIGIFCPIENLFLSYRSTVLLWSAWIENLFVLRTTTCNYVRGKSHNFQFGTTLWIFNEIAYGWLSINKNSKNFNTIMENKACDRVQKHIWVFRKRTN